MKTNFRHTDSIDGVVIVEVYGSKLVENCEAQLTIDLNMYEGDTGVVTPERYIISHGRVPRAFTITGYILASSSDHSRTTADKSLNDLRKMIKNTAGCDLMITMNDSSTYLFKSWDDTTTPIAGFISKFQSTFTADDSDRPDRYELIITFVEGTNIRT